MIINIGSRTDIPAFYSDWFYNRIKEGFVYVRNPYYKNQVTKYKLNSEVVDILVFVTKNPAPMLDRLDEINDFNQYWQVTITPYGKDIEKNVPNKEKVIESFKKLSTQIGKKKIAWRYDPIFINKKYNLKKHIKIFEKMAAELKEYTDVSIISFIDLFEKTKKNFPEVRAVKKDERHKIGKKFVRIADKYDMIIKTCAEGDELARYGVDCSGCLTKSVFEEAIGENLDVPNKLKVREECECLLGNDIGAYNTCGHGCKYCYANYSDQLVKENMKKHDKNSPFLIGGRLDEDEINEAKQESYINKQMRLF